METIERTEAKSVSSPLPIFRVQIAPTLRIHRKTVADGIHDALIERLVVHPERAVVDVEVRQRAGDVKEDIERLLRIFHVVAKTDHSSFNLPK